jgi:hypothetical protein
MGFRDDNASFHSDYPPRFPEHKLHYAGIFLVFVCPGFRLWRSRDGFECHDPVFGFAHHLLRHDQHGTRIDRAQRIQDPSAKVVPGQDLRNSSQSSDPNGRL